MAEKGEGVIPFEGETQVTLFKDNKVRRVFHENEWYFSIVDVIEAVVETASPSRYWRQLRDKLSPKEGFTDLFDKIEKVKMTGRDGKKYPSWPLAVTVKNTLLRPLTLRPCFASCNLSRLQRPSLLSGG